ncbi:hypothetical protein O181_037124 [Austropuccinia psidii MF-1]|uniref:Uncharacterized protein n=1 Tax=Austropuccinia psidii MF-1 TaxID=1389203 RepID=A0A9Q3HC79_9BASI|nr:hypothetical protein [Austropuccinia psidii MF-1]
MFQQGRFLKLNADANSGSADLMCLSWCINEYPYPWRVVVTISKRIFLISSVKDTYKEEFVSNHLFEAQINPELSSKMRHELIDVLYTYNNAFASDNEPLGTIKGHEVDITLNIDRAYPPVLKTPAHPASPRAREALEKHIQELIKLGLLRKVGHNEEV